MSYYYKISGAVSQENINYFVRLFSKGGPVLTPEQGIFRRARRIGVLGVVIIDIMLLFGA